ncbi:MAG TPA: nuclear transport factor 2 family protein [Streptosporangiaceae bacterium]|nr:nuclear transport factor 2 family protein [Streptosporangiaceae bacterium]
MTTQPGTRQPDARQAGRQPDARKVLQDYLDALTAGDLDAIAASFAPDATWSLHGTLPLSGTKSGRQAIMEFLISAGSLYQPGTQRFTFGDITAEGDRAVLEWRVTGTAAATGKAYDNSYCGVFVIRDGQIAEVREYLDSLHAADVLFAD